MYLRTRIIEDDENFRIVNNVEADDGRPVIELAAENRLYNPDGSYTTVEPGPSMDEAIQNHLTGAWGLSATALGELNAAVARRAHALSNPRLTMPAHILGDFVPLREFVAEAEDVHVAA